MLAERGIQYPSKLHCAKVTSYLLPDPHRRKGAILLAKGTLLHNRDNTDAEIEFRQESNFMYLTGVQEENFFFLYDFEHARAYLVAPDLDPFKEIWKGPSPSVEKLLERYDVDEVVRYSGLLGLLKELGPERIYGWGNPEKGLPLWDTALEHELKHFIAHRLVRSSDKDKKKKEEGKGMKEEQQKGGHHHHDHGDDDDDEEEISVFEALLLARIHKTPVELLLCHEATRITSEAHRAVLKAVQPGMMEYQIEALFRYETAKQGAKAQAYLPIVGTGVNAAYLHYTRNDTMIQEGQLVLMDAACEVDCHASDVTRTFPASGRFSPEQEEIYRLVLKMQMSVIEKMACGVDWRAMNVLSQRVGVVGLKNLGILQGDIDDLLESNIIRTFYPHGLGHLLGLNVHDDGLGLSASLPPKRLTEDHSPVEFHSLVAPAGEDATVLPPPSARRNKSVGSSASQYVTPSTLLEPGMLLTVEPGLYFNPAQIERALKDSYLSQFLSEPVLRRYMPVGGVRIEDVVLVLPFIGIYNLTTAPKEVEELERIIQEGQQERQAMALGGGGGSSMAPSELLPEYSEKGYVKVEGKETVQQQQQQEQGPRVEKKKHVGVFKKIIRALRRMF